MNRKGRKGGSREMKGKGNEEGEGRMKGERKMRKTEERKKYYCKVVVVTFWHCFFIKISIVLLSFSLFHFSLSITFIIYSMEPNFTNTKKFTIFFKY